MISPQDKRFWEERGLKDSMKGRGAIFRKKHGQFRVTSEKNKEWTPEEEHEIGAAYMSGYEGEG